MTRTRALFLTVVIIALSAAYADWQAFVLGGRVSDNQRRNTQALCAFRDDLRNRVQSGNDFLKTHPHGIPGITAGTIRVSMFNAQRTLKALSPLICPYK